MKAAFAKEVNTDLSWISLFHIVLIMYRHKLRLRSFFLFVIVMRYVFSNWNSPDLERYKVTTYNQMWATAVLISEDLDYTASIWTRYHPRIIHTHTHTHIHIPTFINILTNKSPNTLQYGILRII